MQDERATPAWDLIGITARPELVPLLAISMGAGLGAAWWLFPEEWTTSYRLIGGGLLGLGAFFIVYANRLVGGTDFN